MVNLDISRLLESFTDFTHLFKQSSFLYYIRHGLHFHTFRFIDVLQRVQRFGMFVLNDSDLEVVSIRELAKRSVLRTRNLLFRKPLFQRSAVDRSGTSSLRLRNQ